MERKNISTAVRLFTHKTKQFKNSVVTLNIITPLDKDAGARALLIHLLARTCKTCPTIYEMNRKLAGLYGASISPAVHKIGESQVLSLSLICLDNRFALKEENVLKESINLLLDCLFAPDITPEGFRQENVEREKRLLIEKINSENDDKRIYSLSRMINEMCCNEFYGINRLGDKQSVKETDNKKLFDIWKDILFTCPIQINVTGDFDEEKITALFKDRFDALKREKDSVKQIHTEFICEADESKIITEKQKVKQGKLVIGLRAGMTYEQDNFPALKVMTAIFGSGTFSKLFMNVREKMSLCYYCSARLIDSKGIITVESGVETENAYKTLDAIRHELDDVRQGNFDDEVIESAKLSLIDTYKSFTDSVIYIDTWATMNCTSAVFKDPEELAETIKNVSREEIIVAANMVSEDTVFILESESEA